MKITEVRKLNTDDLATTAMNLRTEITELRRSIYLGETTNNKIVKAKRKDLARVLTILSENLTKEKM
jgi:ribosomal protein L29